MQPPIGTEAFPLFGWAETPCSSITSSGWLRNPNRDGRIPSSCIVRGVLWVKARPIRVSLEFSMWSTSVTEVALRPTGVAWPVGTKAYGDRVVAILDDIIGSLAVPVMCHRAAGEDMQVDETDLAPLLSAA